MDAATVDAILKAVEDGDADTVETMLKANPQLARMTLPRDQRSEMARMTLLHRADTLAGARRRRPTDGHLRVAQLLIDHGADVNVIVDGYLPPLDVAAWSGNVKIAEVLLANGADPNLGTEAMPVDTAVSHGHRNVFKLLIAAGAKYDIGHTIKLGMLKETRDLLNADPSLANKPTPNGDLPLNLAAGRQGIFKLLLRRGADIHAKDSKGYTSLLAARSAGNERAVQELLSRGVPDDIFGAIVEGDIAKINATLMDDPSAAHPVGDGPVPIIWAVRSGSVEIVKRLMAENVNVHIRREDFTASTPLIAAISYQYDDIVRLLIDYGADPDPDDVTGWPGPHLGVPGWPRFPLGAGSWANPLINSMRHGTLDSIRILLEAGADPNRNTPPVNEWLGLGWPATWGFLQQAKLLMDYGADMQMPGSIKALGNAATHSSLVMIEFLCAHGVNVEAPVKLSDNSREAVRTALQRAQMEGTKEAVDLIREYIEINRLPDDERDRILHPRARFIDAVIDGDADTVRNLLERTPSLLDRTIARVDLLDHAARYGHQDVVDVMAEYGAPITIQAATALGRVDTVASLLDDDPSLLKGLYPDRPHIGNTLLMLAAQHDRVPVIDLLLDRGAKVDAQEPRDGWTALLTAVKFMSVNALKKLLERGANPNLKDRDGVTALKRNGPFSTHRQEIYDILVAHGADPADQRGRF